MTLAAIKALTFDTGGTILDWHTGLTAALADAGRAAGVNRDWAALARHFRQRSLAAMQHHGATAPATKNFDDVHRETLDGLLAEAGLEALDDAQRRAIWHDALHRLRCWPDFPPALAQLRTRYLCVSFTMLSFRLVMDTARCNNLHWDAVLSCEGIGQYKPLPGAYLGCARYLQLKPAECLMVACHNFDLNAARACGFRTAFVRRADEWGSGSDHPADADPHHDLVVESFGELAARLGCA